MLWNAFPDLKWLKHQADTGFSGQRWPNAVLNLKSGATLRDNISGPFSLFSNVSGKSEVTVDNKTTRINDDYFFISNNTQRYTLEIDRAEIFNIHFGENWLKNIVDDCEVEFYNRLYPKDPTVKYLQSQLALPDKTTLEREEILTQLVVHLLLINRNEKIRLDSLEAAKASTREDILRRLHLATDHIYSFYDRDISLDDLSRVSAFSKFHFIRAFKQAFGMAPHQFLNAVRIGKAKDLLKSDVEIRLVGKMIGINDPSSFSRLFKNQTGIYPTVFRKT